MEKAKSYGKSSQYISAAQIYNTYHSIPTVGSSTSTSANDFVYAFLVDGSIAFWWKQKVKDISKRLFSNILLLTYVPYTGSEVLL